MQDYKNPFLSSTSAGLMLACVGLLWRENMLNYPIEVTWNIWLAGFCVLGAFVIVAYQFWNTYYTNKKVKENKGNNQKSSVQVSINVSMNCTDAKPSEIGKFIKDVTYIKGDNNAKKKR